MKIKILCTLGPASLCAEVLQGLDERGTDLYRINLSHTPLEQIEPTIELIRSYSSTEISLDTEGAQVRCGIVEDDVTLEEGEEVTLTRELVPGTRRRFSLWPSVAFETLAPQMLIGIDFDGVLLRLEAVGAGEATASVVRGGRVRSNRAVTMDPPPKLPPLSDKDRAAIQIGARLGITHYALSFASGAADVDLIRAALRLERTSWRRSRAVSACETWTGSSKRPTP